MAKQKERSVLRNKWFSRLPRNINSYTSNRWSSSQQYPINFTRLGCLSCPKKFTSVYRRKDPVKKSVKAPTHQRKKIKTQAYKPFSMTLKSLLVQNLDSNGEGLEPNPNILINVTLVHSAKSSLTENVIRAKTLGNSLELEQCESNDMGVEEWVLAGVVKVAGSGVMIAQIWDRAAVLLSTIGSSIFDRQGREDVELLNCKRKRVSDGERGWEKKSGKWGRSGPWAWETTGLSSVLPQLPMVEGGGVAEVVVVGVEMIWELLSGAWGVYFCHCEFHSWGSESLPLSLPPPTWTFPSFYASFSHFF